MVHIAGTDWYNTSAFTRNAQEHSWRVCHHSVCSKKAVRSPVRQTTTHPPSSVLTVPSCIPLSWFTVFFNTENWHIPPGEQEKYLQTCFFWRDMLVPSRVKFLSLDEGWTLPTKTRFLDVGCCLARPRIPPKGSGVEVFGKSPAFFKGKSRLVKYFFHLGQKHLPLGFLWHLAYLKPFKSRFADPSSQPAGGFWYHNGGYWAKSPSSRRMLTNYPPKMIPEKAGKSSPKSFFFQQFFFRTSDNWMSLQLWDRFCWSPNEQTCSKLSKNSSLAKWSPPLFCRTWENPSDHLSSTKRPMFCLWVLFIRIYIYIQHIWI